MWEESKKKDAQGDMINEIDVYWPKILVDLNHLTFDPVDNFCMLLGKKESLFLIFFCVVT